MDGSHRLVVEDSPDPADLALLEEHVAAAAIAAAGLGDDEEFGIFLRDDEGRIVAGISGIAGVGAASCRRCGSTSRSEVAGSRGHSWPRGGRGSATGLRARTFRAYDLLTPGLYERLGYETVGVIEGCPAGSAARWYRKDM